MTKNVEYLLTVLLNSQESQGGMRVMILDEECGNGDLPLLPQCLAESLGDLATPCTRTRIAANAVSSRSWTTPSTRIIFSQFDGAMSWLTAALD
ncbi:hypothetical protein KC350_g61 [Hortaea werneckii]|nr:hypothetical protein KC350_g61 [Hortaea werneckii]